MMDCGEGLICVRCFRDNSGGDVRLQQHTLYC
jgi:hypothetical protein